MKRLQAHCANFEPALKQSKAKYESVLKDLMLVQLEKERMQTRMENLEAQVKQLEAMNSAQAGGFAQMATRGLKSQADNKRVGSGSKRTPFQASKTATSGKLPAMAMPRETTKTPRATTAEDKQSPSKPKVVDSVIPPDDRVNPHSTKAYSAALGHKFTLKKTFKGHQVCALSGLSPSFTEFFFCSCDNTRRPSHA